MALGCTTLTPQFSLPASPVKKAGKLKSRRKKRKTSILARKDRTKESRETVSKEEKISSGDSTKMTRGHGKTSRSTSPLNSAETNRGQVKTNQPDATKICRPRATTPVQKTGDRHSAETTKGGADLDSGTSEFSVFLSKSKDARLVWLLHILGKGVGYLVRRFRENMRYKSSSATTLASNANLAKNRYEDIRCIDATRVILKGRPSDYIHANWITLADGRRFICSQAPLQSTVDDFWHMIIQENCRTIIMLCKLVEDEKEKCAKYFPQSSENSLTFGSTKVSLIKKTVSEHGYTASTWKVQDRGRQFTIRHLQCTSWPDQSAPKSSLEVIGIHKEILKVPKENPIVIHCSAGVGRTCTLIGIELLLERIRRRQDVSGVAIMKWLRDRRFGAIQKGIQFVFMHYVTVELLCQEGVMKSDDPKVVAFQQKYQKLWTKQKQIMIKNKPEEKQSLRVVKTQYDDDESTKEKKLKQTEKRKETLQKKLEDEKIEKSEKTPSAAESSSLTPQEPSLSLVPEMDKYEFSDFFEFL